MAAKTGRDKRIASIVERCEIADLVSQALTLMRDGKRSPAMVANLRRALQLFKERSLGRVLQEAECLEPALVQETLSMKVETFLSSRHVHYCRENGVIFIGELFVRRFWANQDTQVAVACRNLLEQLGLPASLSLDGVGWIPPYAEDESVLAAMGEPWRRNSPRLGTFGEALRKMYLSGYIWSHYNSFVLVVKRAPHLRMAMYVSPQMLEQAKSPT